MKLPIGFGNKFFFRVVFPGVILATCLLKPTIIILLQANLDSYLKYVFAMEIFILGWLFVVLDMPIYMVFEGRRYWPVWLIKNFQGMERQRLASLHRTMRSCEAREMRASSRFHRAAAGKRYLETAVEISDFPLDARRSMPEVVWPTRLGNLIAAYEQYPLIKYGLDAVFFWPRIWVSIDQSLREEIDNQQAQADGLLYSVAALVLSGAIFFIYSAFHLEWPQNYFGYILKINDVLISSVCIFAAFILYRLSLYTHRQYGELFKATFDQYKDKIALEGNVKLVSHIIQDPELLNEIDCKKNIAVWRFLRWHRARLRGEAINRRVRMP